MVSLSCPSCAGPLATPALRGPTLCPWCGHSALVGVAATGAAMEAEAVQSIARAALARRQTVGGRLYDRRHALYGALGGVAVLGSLVFVAAGWVAPPGWAGSLALVAGFCGCWAVGLLGGARRRMLAVGLVPLLALPFAARVVAGFAGMDRAGPEWWLAPIVLGVVGVGVVLVAPAKG